MLVQKQVGPVTTTSSLAAGASINGRLGNMGEDIVSELHGRYYETTYRRANFSASALATTHSSTGVPTTGAAFTGVVLVNPPGNVFNMVVNKFNAFHSVAPTAGVIGLARAYGLTAIATTTAPAAPGTSGVNRYAGGAAPTGSLYIVGTYTFAPAAIVTNVVGYNGATLLTTTAQQPSNLIDLEGGFILPPGSLAAVYLSAASGASGLNVSVDWEEVPV